MQNVILTADDRYAVRISRAAARVLWRNGRQVSATDGYPAIGWSGVPNVERFAEDTDMTFDQYANGCDYYATGRVWYWKIIRRYTGAELDAMAAAL